MSHHQGFIIMEPSISNQKLERWKKVLIFWVGPALLVLAIGLSCFKQYTDLGRAADNDVYDPQENGVGFVSKANQVLSLLLSPECIDSNYVAISLDSLNKRYKALEFALPFGEEGNAFIESSNLRLVGIHPEYIKDENLRRFYYNSRLPQLLERQAEHLGENYFNIRCKSELHYKGSSSSNPHRLMPINIESITLIPSMFKVKMMKTPWTGVIEGMADCLFSEEGTIYLTYGNSVLPIHRDSVFNETNPINFNAIMNEGILLWTRPVNSGQKTHSPEPIDYYSYYKKAFDDHGRSHNVRIRFQNSREENNKNAVNMTLAYSHDSLRITHDCGLWVVGKGEPRKFKNNVRGGETHTVPFEDGMKILMYTMEENDLSMKLGEITLSKENPMHMLSYLTQSSIGVDRFFISDYQTDLFTQQLLQGLSQHLSNRENIDTVKLSIDPLLSREFEHEIKAYVEALGKTISKSKPEFQKNEQYDMSVTIMDLATGEVLATPFYTTLFDKEDFPEVLKLTTRNTALCRRSVGSAFKPMEALAAVLAVPSLIDLDTSNPKRYANPVFKDSVHKGRGEVIFFGRKTEPWAKKYEYFWNGCDFTTFLSRSDDVYPVSLVALALSDENVSGSTTTLCIDDEQSYFTTKDNKGYLRFKNEGNNGEKLLSPANQPFISNMSVLYKVNYAESSDDMLYSRTADINLFDKLVEGIDDWEERVYGLYGVSPEPTQLRFDRFNDGEDFHDLLMPWVLGQGDNMWNCVKLAEAWARMIGKRDVNASFIHHPDNANCPSLVRGGLKSFGTDSNSDTVWNSFLTKFKKAQESGSLLPPMYNAVKNLNDSLVLFSKTGTPDAYSPPIDIPLLGSRVRKMDLGLYCFVLTKDQIYLDCIRQNKPAKGIVCIVRVARTYECANCGRNKQCKECEGYNGINSSHARDFFANNPINRHLLRKLYDMTRKYF